MASKEKRGNVWRIEYRIGKHRHRLRLGPVTKRAAVSAAIHVDALVAAMQTNTAPNKEALAWAMGLNDELYDSLAAVGLVTPRYTDTLCEFVQEYIDKRPAKPTTKGRWRQVHSDLS